MFEGNTQLSKQLPLLIADHSTGKNIVWATDTYSSYGSYYKANRQMFSDFNINLIQDGILLPRVQKTKEQQQSRTKNKAEVFTPSWICNKMNNHCDEDWFGAKNIFNNEVEKEDGTHTWVVTITPVPFKNRTVWQQYVNSKRIEITCGEAPYIVSRYDTTSGEIIPIKERIGILDRKLRVINENTKTESNWLKWVQNAYRSVYGFEYQGDNLFFARVNLVQTFIDYYEDRFGTKPKDLYVKRIAEIVSWNFWQMDGLKDIAPFGIPVEPIFYGTEEDKDCNEIVYAKIKDWDEDAIIEYRTMKGELTNEV